MNASKQTIFSIKNKIYEQKKEINYKYNRENENKKNEREKKTQKLWGTCEEKQQQTTKQNGTKNKRRSELRFVYSHLFLLKYFAQQQKQ